MELHLTDEERATLLDVLNTAYVELRDEIANTESYDLRQSLKHTGQVLIGLLDRLEPGWAARQGVELPVPPGGAG